MATINELYSFSRDFDGTFIVLPVDLDTGDPVPVSAEAFFGGKTFESPEGTQHDFFVSDNITSIDVTLGESLTHIVPTQPFNFSFNGRTLIVEIQLAPIQFSGIVVKFDTLPVRPPLQFVASEDALFCPCDFRCDFEEKVFADEEGTGITNDFSDFLFRKISSGDSVTIELLKENVVLAEITDNTYGDYYDGFTAQPLYVGWQADWTKIFQNFSGGRYQVRITTVILGQESIFLSRYFRLNTFDEISANNTVKIETFQSGRIDNIDFDFNNLVEGGWRSSIRIEGQFGQMSPSIERDIYQDSSYREVQNRDTINREYKLNGRYVSESIFERITTKDMLANEILITSYDLLQERKYEKFPVVVDSFDDPSYDDLGNVNFVINFSDRQKNIIKTNVT